MKDKKMIELIFSAIVVAMAVASVVLNCLEKIEVKSSITLLGIGLFCTGILSLSKIKK